MNVWPLFCLTDKLYSTLRYSEWIRRQLMSVVNKMRIRTHQTRGGYAKDTKNCASCYIAWHFTLNWKHGISVIWKGSTVQSWWYTIRVSHAYPMPIIFGCLTDRTRIMPSWWAPRQGCWLHPENIMRGSWSARCTPIVRPSYGDGTSILAVRCT